MASSLQPKPGLKIVRKHQVRLGGVNSAGVVVGRFGPSKLGSIIYCLSPAALYNHFEPSITIDKRTLKFSETRPPQPRVVADWLLEEDAQYAQLDQLQRWLSSAPAKALIALRDRLALPAK